MGVLHSFEKNETATMFFLKKPSLVPYSTDITRVLIKKLHDLPYIFYLKVCCMQYCTNLVTLTELIYI